jgi:release factor glutamine methyltransferase
VREKLLRATTDRLKITVSGSARLEAKMLLEAAGDDMELFERLVIRRLAGEPVDRIIGHRGFWTHELIITSDTLSPRADTETIVEAARDHASKNHSKDAALRILDLGTGTGAILLALLHEFPRATGLGVDVSSAAVEVARRNAALNQLETRASFHLGSWATGITEQFDIVVSNPPYIPSADIAGLECEVREHDPLLALDGGTDGLDAYRILLPLLPHLMKPNGVAVFEIGFGQEPDIASLATLAGLQIGEIRDDLGGVPRAVVMTMIAQIL